MITLHKAKALTTAALRSFESCITPGASLLARRRRYHTERYQTKALKERVKELEAEVARVTDLLDSERKGSEVLNRQVTRLGNFRRFSLCFRPPWG